MQRLCPTCAPGDRQGADRRCSTWPAQGAAGGGQLTCWQLRALRHRRRLSGTAPGLQRPQQLPGTPLGLRWASPAQPQQRMHGTRPARWHSTGSLSAPEQAQARLRRVEHAPGGCLRLLSLEATRSSACVTAWLSKTCSTRPASQFADCPCCTPFALPGEHVHAAPCIANNCLAEPSREPTWAALKAIKQARLTSASP